MRGAAITLVITAFAPRAALASDAGVDADGGTPTAEEAVEETIHWSSKGDLGIESRAFLNDDDPLTEDRGAGMVGRLEVRYARGVFDAKVRGMGRFDHFDDRRAVLIPEEAWAQVRWSRVRIRAGLDIVNWTATEAFHPADVVNARNLDSDLESFEKVGEPMAELQVRPFEGTTVDGFFMPFFVAPILTSPASRLSFAPPGIELDVRPDPGEFHPQFAFQIRQVLGSADVTLHFVHQRDRSQPTVGIDATTFEPYLSFHTVSQVGGTYQQAKGPFVLKLEAAARRFGTATRDRDHLAAAGGLEYNLDHAGGSQSTFLLEGQALLGVEPATRDALSPFTRDVLVGWRFAANDAAGLELFAAAIADVETRDEVIAILNVQRRLGETWTVRAGVRIFEAPARAAPLSPLRRADHVRLTLTRHF